MVEPSPSNIDQLVNLHESVVHVQGSVAERVWYNRVTGGFLIIGGTDRSPRIPVHVDVALALGLGTRQRG